MASKIEHHVKYNAHMDTVLWAKSDSITDKDMAIHLAKEKYKAHGEYIKGMESNGKYWYGTPPRSKFLNWLGHKCLELAWTRSLYQ